MLAGFRCIVLVFWAVLGDGFDFNIEVFCVIEFWVFLVFKLFGGVGVAFSCAAVFVVLRFSGFAVCGIVWFKCLRCAFGLLRLFGLAGLGAMAVLRCLDCLVWLGFGCVFCGFWECVLWVLCWVWWFQMRCWFQMCWLGCVVCWWFVI